MSSSISQKQAVVDGVKNVLGSNFDPSVPAKQQLSSSQISSIKDSIVTGITSGSVVYKGDNTNTAKVKAYVSGLISNHLRKAKELNGGSGYTPSQKRPNGGKKDSVISELKTLLSTLEAGSEAYSEVESEITKRLTSIVK